MMTDLLAHAHTAWNDPSGPKEALFHCGYDTAWSLSIPEQIRTAVSVRCTDPFPPSSANCLVEIHSHHEMPPLFSSTDDQDETGFRIFGVLGHFGHTPQILFRIGIYGHFFYIPADTVTDLPPGLQDGLLPLHDEDPIAPPLAHAETIISTTTPHNSRTL